MSLYFLVMLCSIAGPLLLSFDKKVAFYRSFRYLFLAIIIVAIPFILWDIIFTENAIWGFNEKYLQGIFIFNLPIEECLFFIVVPFCCVFIYEVFRIRFPKFYSELLTKLFAISILMSGSLLCILYLNNWYTASACLFAGLLTIVYYYHLKVSWYKNFVVCFLICQIPFLIVNGILTGTVTPEPVVWYSENHIIGPRIWTIPIEDIFYNYSMLLPIIGLFEFFRNRKYRA